MKIFWKIFIIIFLLSTLVGVGGYFLLNTPRFWTSVGTAVIKKNFPDISVDLMTLAEVKLQLPTAVYFSNLHVNVTDHDQSHSMELGQLRVTHDPNQVDPSIVHLGAEDGFYTSENLKLSGISLDLAGTLPSNNQIQLSGAVLIRRANIAELIVRDIQAHIEGNANQMSIIIDDALFYGGHLSGQIKLDLKHGLSYHVDLNMKDANLTQMQQYNQKVFSQVSGIVDGHVVMQGEGNEIKVLTSDFQSSSKAAMKAALMQWYLNYIPENTQQRKLIQQLIKNGGSIPLSSVHMTVSKQDEDTLQATFEIKSRELNLNTNYTVDVNVEGGLNNVLFFNQFKSRTSP